MSANIIVEKLIFHHQVPRNYGDGLIKKKAAPYIWAAFYILGVFSCFNAYIVWFVS